MPSCTTGSKRGLVAPDADISVNLSARELADASNRGARGRDAGRRQLRPVQPDPRDHRERHDAGHRGGGAEPARAQGARARASRSTTSAPGYSSLAYLEQFPVDILKIDRSFVTALADDEDPVGLAQAIIQIAETLGHMHRGRRGRERGTGRRACASWAAVWRRATTSACRSTPRRTEEMLAELRAP